jgi:hypothetical protein
MASKHWWLAQHQPGTGSSMPPTTTTEPDRPRPARPERAAGVVVGGVAASVAFAPIGRDRGSTIRMLTDAGYEIPDWRLAGSALSYAAVRLPYSHVVLSEFGSKAESAAR